MFVCRCNKGYVKECYHDHDATSIDYKCPICGRTYQHCWLSGCLFPTDQRTRDDNDVLRNYVHYDHTRLKFDEFGFIIKPYPLKPEYSHMTLADIARELQSYD